MSLIDKAEKRIKLLTALNERGNASTVHKTGNLLASLGSLVRNYNDDLEEELEDVLSKTDDFLHEYARTLHKGDN